MVLFRSNLAIFKESYNEIIRVNEGPGLEPENDTK